MFVQCRAAEGTHRDVIGGGLKSRSSEPTVYNSISVQLVQQVVLLRLLVTAPSCGAVAMVAAAVAGEEPRLLCTEGEGMR